MVRPVFAFLAGAALLAGGCASTTEATLRLEPARNAHTTEVFWPPAPEVPRYVYIGQLLGESNYRDGADERREGAKAFLHWLVGLVAGEDGPTGLVRPQSGVADASGRILVADAARQAIVVFDPKAGLDTWERASGLVTFRMPVGIATSPEGRVWISDAELGYIVELDREGRPVRTLGEGRLKRPTGIAYDAAGRRLFVADTHAHDIKVFDAEGALMKILGRRGEGAGEFNYPTHLAFARGELYVADTMNSRVQVLADGGDRHRLTVGARGLYVGNLVRPKGVAVDGDGNIYVVESYYDHLLVYDREGNFLLPIGGLGKDVGQFYLPSGVWTDARNRVFVADMFNGRVVVLQFLGGDPNGG